MKKLGASLVWMPAVGILAGSWGSALAAEAVDIAGTWELSWIQFGATNVERVELKTLGEKLSGKAWWGCTIEGTVAGNKLEFKLVDSDKNAVATVTGAAQAGVLAGSLKIKTDEYDWFAHRPATRPAAAPRSHDFAPTQFHNYFSGKIAPVLRLWPGDTVHTETVDAGGIDKKGVRRSRGGNPLTGPFYVEGALDGDTLVVHFNRIRLNRDTAESGTSIVAGALEPGYRPAEIKDFDGSWKLDRQQGVARLGKPTDKLKPFTVPLEPFLGCVGVAPYGHQEILSGELGAYGGNLDYKQLREGTTVYLPVFQPGALLYVGDGHAAQGDGELTGDALETSMEVEFTIDLVRGKSSGPRIESDEYVMAVGVGNSLTEALQASTTQLARWLEEEYKLNSSEVAMVMGFAVQYDIAEVVDPHVNVVAKIKRSALAGLMR